MSPLRICLVSSEIVPFSKTGGLADVCGALGKYLGKQGHDVRLFTPFYDSIDTSRQEFHPVDFLQHITVGFGGFSLEFSVLTSRLPETTTDVYFIYCPALYNRGKIYSDEPDEYLRFALLCRATIECCQRMGWGPDVFHCNDWQAALIPLFLKTHYSWDQLFAATQTVLTLHNVGYQGVFPSEVLPKLGLENQTQLLAKDDLQRGVLNYLKIGLLHAGVITTVSETYAREIQTAEFGAGLEGLLQQRSDHLIGILNGVDYQEWNPETDALIPFHYSAADLRGKEKNKRALLAQFNMPYRKGVPLYAGISRLTGQKGFELLQEILYSFIASHEMQFILLGSGEEKYTRFFEAAARALPGKVAFYNGYHTELAHRIEAGSDMFVMPSRYEPCGLNQIYSLRYGTVPIVRKTGGLADTVQLYDWQAQTGTGFVFEYFNADSLNWAMDYAYQTYQHQDAWKGIMLRGMRRNFSWEVQVEKYIELYRRLTGTA